MRIIMEGRGRGQRWVGGQEPVSSTFPTKTDNTPHSFLVISCVLFNQFYGLRSIENELGGGGQRNGGDGGGDQHDGRGG